MIVMNERILTYWQEFQASLLPDSVYLGREFVAEGWGDDPTMAEELGALIASGVKTATCSSVWEWGADGQTWPSPGFLTIVLDGRDEPLCIVETVEITVKPYNEVDASMAYDEGEGDRTLDYWRAAHRIFFTRVLAKIDRQFVEDMPLVCERFKRIYP